MLLYGETGVGKDLLATIIHRNSHRQAFPYIKVGCTLFPPQLIESELYGHEKGSFTGADQQRKGRFDLAEGGTLYLDDVDDIPLEQQSKLLRAIEEKVFERVGGVSLDQGRRADHRLDQAESLGEDRRGHFPRGPLLSARRAADQHSAAARAPGGRAAVGRTSAQSHCRPAIAPAEIAAGAPCELLARHDWPGNVRELYHTLERAYLIGGGAITAEILATEIGGPDPNQRLPVGGFQAAIDHAEKQLLQDALRNSGGNKTAAAAALGMKPSTFRDKLAKHGLGHAGQRRNSRELTLQCCIGSRKWGQAPWRQRFLLCYPGLRHGASPHFPRN